MPLRAFALVALALLVAVATAPTRDGAIMTNVDETTRCSLGMYPPPDSQTTYVLARGTDDTVVAGAGMIKLSAASPRRTSPVYGQVLRVDSVTLANAPAIRGALAARRSNEIVVVPWSYAPDCGNAHWHATARWVTPELLGVFPLWLRPESLWVTNRPTFDAKQATIGAYGYGIGLTGPQTVIRDRMRAAVPMLSVTDVFTLVASLPVRGQTSDAESREPLLRLLRERPHLATTFPGNEIVQWYR